MTQKLASAKADGRPLDFGLSIAFDPAQGMRALGRADNASYVGPWFPGLTANDVTLTDVADNYTIAGPAETDPWKIRWGNKAGVPPDQFPGIMLGAYLAMAAAQSQTPAQGLDRLSRLRGDQRLSMIWQTLAAPTLKNVDPNDIRGNFRALVGIMRTTAATGDGQPLLLDAEEAAIAAAFPNKSG